MQRRGGDDHPDEHRLRVVEDITRLQAHAENRDRDLADIKEQLRRIWEVLSVLQHDKTALQTAGRIGSGIWRSAWPVLVAVGSAAASAVATWWNMRGGHSP